MGRIVINRTENDQTVVLNDTAEGVSGGYFDKDMNWKELGGSDYIDYDLGDMIRGGLSDSSTRNYFDERENVYNRNSNKYFRSVPAGNYILVLTASASDISFGLSMYTNANIDSVLSHANITGTTSTGWIKPDTEFIIDAAHPFVRLTAKKDDDSTFDSDLGNIIKLRKIS